MSDLTNIYLLYNLIFNLRVIFLENKMFKYFFIVYFLVFLVSCSDSAYFDPGPCPRAAILKGSETKQIDRTDLVIELNRTIMIC